MEKKKAIELLVKHSVELQEIMYSLNLREHQDIWTFLNRAWNYTYQAKEILEDPK